MADSGNKLPFPASVINSSSTSMLQQPTVDQTPATPAEAALTATAPTSVAQATPENGDTSSLLQGMQQPHSLNFPGSATVPMPVLTSFATPVATSAPIEISPPAQADAPAAVPVAEATTANAPVPSTSPPSQAQAQAVVGAQGSPASSVAGTQSQEGKVLKVEDALTYLDEVKRQFGDKPHIYNMFLEIMKSFKAETIDTPGVIQKVSELFRGHNNLILGFNTFLPPGYRIDSADLLDDKLNMQHGPQVMGQQQQQQQQQQHQTGLPPPPPGAGLGIPAHLLTQAHAQMLPGSMLLPGGGHHMVMDQNFFMSQPYYADPSGHPHPYMMMMPEAALQQQQQLQAQQQAAAAAAQGQGAGQPLEFDHAINYVTKIKRRFANDSDTYKAFLEILHTYQKEQKSIKEVLDQVSELFRDHSDLLKEFTYFLPDGVRERAKQEINKIQNRRRKEESRKNEKKGGDGGKGAGGALGRKEGKDRGGVAAGSMMGSGGMMMAPSILGSGMMMMQPPMMAGGKSVSPVMGGRLGEDDDLGADRADRAITITLSKIPKMEKRLFNRIRAALSSRERWNSFLKCLELFSLEILTRQELITLCGDIFIGHAELLEEFDRLLASRGVTEDMVEDSWFCLPMAEIEFDNTRRCTPSYRALPASYPRPPCSERTLLCRAVLNDTFVSVPSSQAEESSFKAAKRNQYEEALFRCEDERFELDMVIESNLSTINALEPLAREIVQEGRGEGEERLKLDRRTLSVIHLKAIARVYGERSKEMFELLRKSPASAIPIIVQRLKQKDQELRAVRTKMNDVWREVQERNYVKSLDHSSFQFKTTEKRVLSNKFMLAEVKDCVEKKFTLEFGDAFVHRHALGLITTYTEKQLGRTEVDRVVATFEKAVSRLLGVRTMGGRSLSAAPKSGAKVLTRYGAGTVSGNGGEVKLMGNGNIVRVPREEMLEFIPLSVKEPSSNQDQQQCMVGQEGYLFLRFYALLCERLAKAEALCGMMEKDTQRPQLIKHVVDRNGSEDEQQYDETAQQQQQQQPNGESLLSRTMDKLRQVLGGQLDNNKFEDELYEMLGTSCYFLFTIDKLLAALLRTLQNLSSSSPAQKVAELAAKYAEKKTASNAAEVYRASADALNVSGTVTGMRVRNVSGGNPVCPPQKRGEVAASGTTASGGAEDKILANLNVLWETPAHVVLEFMESIPQTVTFGSSGTVSGRSLSPSGLDADGSATLTEMGEIEFALPIRVEMKPKASSPSISSLAAVIAAADDASKSPMKKQSLDEVSIVLAIFTAEKLPGSDDVFKRINAFKADPSSVDKQWWRAANPIERATSPVPDESSSSNEAEEPPTSKRLRSAAAVEDAE